MDEANTLLDRAAEFDSDEAWTYYHAAARQAVVGLTPAEVWDEQQILLAEARESSPVGAEMQSRRFSSSRPVAPRRARMSWWCSLKRSAGTAPPVKR